MTEPGKTPHIGRAEFVALIAAIMALNALGIDIMLPALPAIADSLGIAHGNDRQLVISVYMFGFGLTQLVFGPLSDRIGRKPVLLTGMILYAVASIGAGLVTSFAAMILMRLLQGMAGASGRVLATAIVRDRHSGNEMAQMMSLAFTVFMAVPILAPSLGQLIVLSGSWRLVFYLLGGAGFAIAIWFTARLPETLRPEHRRPIQPRLISEAIGETIRHPQSIGYTLVSTIQFGALIGYVTSSQQIFETALGVPQLLAPLFALIAVGIAISAVLNSRLVHKIGSRRISHASLVGVILVSAVHLGWLGLFGESIASFTLFQLLTMLCLGFAGPNCGALAMEPVGHIAGTASSVQGTISTLGSAAVGFAIGQAFDGTTMPLTAGTLACSLVALAIIMLVERRRQRTQ